jgi:hypothetical protein
VQATQKPSQVSPLKNRDGGKAPMNKNSMYLLDQRDSLVNNGKKKWNSQG